MELHWTLELILLVLAVLIFLWRSSKTRTINLPPGPPALPFIGHLHLFGPNPHQSFRELSKRYGPLLSLKLGAVTAIVVSDSDTARQVLQTHDSVFCSRPVMATMQMSLLHRNDIAFSPYGDRVKSMRRLCTTQLFAAKRVQYFTTTVVMDEVRKLCDSLSRLGSVDEVIIIRDKLRMLTFNVMTRVLMRKVFCYWEPGRKESKFLEALDKQAEAMLKPSFADHFPKFAWMDFYRMRQARKFFSEVGAYIQKFMDEHQESKDDPDFVDTMEEYFGRDEQGKVFTQALLLDLIAAGSDTSWDSLEWTLAELLRHPPVMSKLQNEIDTAVGSHRMVEDADLPKLEFLDCVIKESLRLHPPAALLLPHSPAVAHKLQGYDIPKGSTIFINACAIMRDPNVWEQPEAFDPERFVGRHISHTEFIPFGSGRRMCPGVPLALKMVPLTVANLVHGFELTGCLGDGPIPEVTRVGTFMAHPLEVKVALRHQ